MAYDLSESAVYLSTLLAKGFSRSFQLRAASLGFAPGQFPILVELWNEDGLTQRDLVAKLEIEQATIANTLSRMERDGLIERRSHPKDKRAQLLFLTARAREIEAEAKAAAREADDALFKGFKRFERELMLEYMRWAVANARQLEDEADMSDAIISNIKRIPV
jgi:DNA-binding MarR family transcriptional regulator